jgi:hypothetical protein
MNYSKLASKLRTKLANFSGYVSKGLDKSAKRFIREACYGILSSQSVLLTEMGRSLETRLSLKKIEERFCRQLYKEQLWEHIHTNILHQASTRIKDDTLLVLDLSDIHKKYAREMEYLARVHDGSDGGAIVNGYWSIQVIGAELNSNELIPLYQDLYSQNAPDFISENDEILTAIKMIDGQLNGRGIWVIDRGGDRRVLYDHLLYRHSKKRFIIRLVGNRNLICGRTTKLASELADNCPCPYQDVIIKEKNGKEKVFNISYGYKKVKLPNHDDELFMLVVKGFGANPMMLLTTEPLRRNKEVLRRILSSYIKRWSIEETIRFVKQTYDVENIRVLKYTRMKNIMALLLVVFYFIAVVIDTSQKLKIMTGHLLKQAKRVFGIPNFKYYALGDGISAIFKKSPGKIHAKTKKTKLNQLSFGFT